MPYSIVFSLSAAKQYKKLKDKKLKNRIVSALEYMSQEPLAGKVLQAEFKGCYSYRISLYRIIYSFSKEKNILSIMRIEHRRGVYR